MVSRHTTYRKLHEPPTSASRALEVTPVKFLLKRMVTHDDFCSQKPVVESREACGCCACGSSSVFVREIVGAESSNSLVGMSACIGSDSLVGVSACIGSDSLVGVSACVGSYSLVGMSACVRSDGSVGLFERLRDQSFCVFGAGKSIAPSSQRSMTAQETCCVARRLRCLQRKALFSHGVDFKIVLKSKAFHISVIVSFSHVRTRDVQSCSSLQTCPCSGFLYARLCQTRAVIILDRRRVSFQEWGGPGNLFSWPRVSSPVPAPSGRA